MAHPAFEFCYGKLSSYVGKEVEVEVLDKFYEFTSADGKAVKKIPYKDFRLNYDHPIIAELYGKLEASGYDFRIMHPGGVYTQDVRSDRISVHIDEKPRKSGKFFISSIDVS